MPALPPTESGFLPPVEDVEGTQSLGMNLIRAMIAAARSDGKLDPEESQVIFDQIQQAKYLAWQNRSDGAARSDTR
jgi:uncharacterized membrane protein YebE (DUF533 family)